MTNGTTRPLRGADHEILRALRLHGPSTRADLVRRTGLSRATVSATAARLAATTHCPPPHLRTTRSRKGSP